jgi:hypothetical protein
MKSGDHAVFPNVALDAAAIKTAAIVAFVTLVLGLAMAIGLWMPGALYDDAYFSGPAIWFATTGEMKNFLLDMDAIPKISDLPLFYTPIYFYVLGYWFALFGCSTVSALCFYATLAAASSAGVSLSLSRLGCSPLWCLGSAMISWTTFYAATVYGLRPEPLALAFLLVGLPLIPSSRSLLQCTGFLLSGLGCITAPRVAGWAVAFGGLFVIGPLDRPRTVARNAVIGGGLALLLLVWSIRLELTAFYKTFTATAALRSPSIQSSFEIVLDFMTNGFGKLNWLGVTVVLALGAIASLLLGSWRATCPLLSTFGLGCFFALLTGGYATVIFIYIVAMGLWGMLRTVPNATYLRQMMLATCAILAGIPLIIVSASFFKARYQDPELWVDYRKIESAVSNHQWREVWIDHFSLRYVFDMKPPLTARLANSHLAELAKDQVPQDPETSFVLSEAILQKAAPTKFPDQPGIRVFGRVFKIYARPQIHLITHEGVIISTRMPSQ